MVDSLDTVVRANSVQMLDSLSLYSRDGEPLWTSMGTPADAPALDMDEATAAEDILAPVSTVVDTPTGRTLQVTVPVVYGDRLAGVYGFAQVNIPWETAEASVWRAVLDGRGGDRGDRAAGLAPALPDGAPGQLGPPYPGRRRTSGWRCTTR